MGTIPPTRPVCRANERYLFNDLAMYQPPVGLDMLRSIRPRRDPNLTPSRLDGKISRNPDYSNSDSDSSIARPTYVPREIYSAGADQPKGVAKKKKITRPAPGPIKESDLDFDIYLRRNSLQGVGNPR